MTAAQSVLLSLLAERAPNATLCPSEVARKLATDDGWRVHMTDVHAAVDALHQQDMIKLSWKGRALVKRTGPYRIGRAME